MSEQISSILVTLTVFNTSVAIYSYDLTRTKSLTLKSTKTVKNKKKITKKHLQNFLKHKKHDAYTFIKKTFKKCVLHHGRETRPPTEISGYATVCIGKTFNNDLT